VLDPATGLLKVPVSRIAPRWVSVPFLYTLARWSSHLVANDRGDAGESIGSASTDLDAD
jgi:hypothetical protein